MWLEKAFHFISWVNVATKVRQWHNSFTYSHQLGQNNPFIPKMLVPILHTVSTAILLPYNKKYPTIYKIKIYKSGYLYDISFILFSQFSINTRCCAKTTIVKFNLLVTPIILIFYLELLQFRTYTYILWSRNVSKIICLRVVISYW